MQSYYSGCKKHTDDIYPKKLIMTNKDIKGKSRCVDCMANKMFFEQVKHKGGSDIIVSQFLIN